MINQKIKKLRKEGFSIREISKKLNESYGKVQRACSDIKMSKSGLIRYFKLNGLTKQILFKDELTEAKVRIMGNLLFDGAVYKIDYHYSIMYVNSSEELIKQFIDDMKEVYNIEPSSFEDIDNYQRVKYLSKQIYNDLMKYFKSYSTSNKDCSIPFAIMNGNKLFQITILRAFWENEGSIAKDGKLSADLKSLKVIKQLSKLHNELGLKHNISKYWKNGWAYKLFLYKSKENYKIFLNLNLFSKSKVTKGYFIGKKKIDILKGYFDNKYK